MAVAVTVAVAVSGGGAAAVAVPVAGLTKIFFNHIQKDFLINVWCYRFCFVLLWPWVTFLILLLAERMGKAWSVI